MNIKRIKGIRLVMSLILAAVLFLGSSLISTSAQAGTLEDIIGRATGNFLESILDGYQKEAQSGFDNNLKGVKKTVSTLSDLLDKVSKNPTEANRQQAIKSIKDSQDKLQELAQAFTGLATKTEKFDTTLESSVDELLSLVRGKVRNNLNESENAFNSVAAAIAKLADDGKKVNDKNFLDVAAGLSKDIQNITKAAGVVNQSISAFAS